MEKKSIDLHQELLLTHIKMETIDFYLHSGSSSKRLFECNGPIQIGIDRIYLSKEDIDFLKTIPYIRLVESNHLLYVEVSETNC